MDAFDLTIADLPGAPILAAELVEAFHQAQGPLAQARVLWWAWRHDPNIEPSTAERMGAVLARFARRQATLGCQRLDQASDVEVAGFIWARTRRGRTPAIATVHLRRTAVRLAFRTLADLGVAAVDPTGSLALPPKTRAELRPLDDDEVTLLRIAAAGRTRRRLVAMATVALAEATATTGEISAVRWGDIDLDGGRVALAGAGRVLARSGTLTSWGARVLADLHRTHDPDGHALVVYRGQAVPGSQPSQAAIVNRLRHLLRTAGLDGDDIRPASIRLWQPARQLAGGGRIETAAGQLGLASLDVAAALLGYDWQAR